MDGSPRAPRAGGEFPTHSIPFPVLSDSDLAAHRAYRVLHQADRAVVARLRSFGMDLEKSSGRDHHVIAVPAIFVIDAKGVVRFAQMDSDYTTRPSTAQILAAIDDLELKPPRASAPAHRAAARHYESERIMAWIEVTDETDATGELKAAYGYVASAGGTVANILKIHSVSPKAMTTHLDLYRQLMFAPSELSRRQREEIAVVVSATNACHY